MFSRVWGIFKHHDEVLEGSLGVLEVLPEETITHILSFVGVSELMSCFLVCRDFYRLANDNAQWHQRCVLRQIDTGTSLNLRSPRNLPRFKSSIRGIRGWWQSRLEDDIQTDYSRHHLEQRLDRCLVPRLWWLLAKVIHVPDKVFAKY